MLNLIDTHAHLDMAQFKGERDEVIKRAHKNSLEYIINIGTDLKS